MKAVAYNIWGPPEVLREMNLTAPEPWPDEVQIKVHATSVNPLDWKMRGRHMKFKRHTGFPIVPGFDVAGVVTEVGGDVRHLKVGDEVFGYIDPRKDGASAEYARAREAFLAPKPPSLTWTEAAAVPLAGLTAMQSLRLIAKMKEGERVLVVGASGGVGHFAVQIARAYGARVSAVCGSRNAELAARLGAEAVFAYDKEDVPQGETFDVVFDTVAAKDFAWARPRLNRKGRYVSTHPDVKGVLLARLLGLFGYSRQCRFVIVHPDPHGLKYLTELIEAGKVKPVIQHEYKLDELADAHRESEAGHVVGKLAVKVSD